MPSGRTFERLYIFFEDSYLSLLQLPCGVSMRTVISTGFEDAARFAVSAVLRFMMFSGGSPTSLECRFHAAGVGSQIVNLLWRGAAVQPA